MRPVLEVRKPAIHLPQRKPRKMSSDHLPTPPRWTQLRYHDVQATLWRDIVEGRSRFIVNPAARRGGKSEIAKRGGVWRGLTASLLPTPMHDLRIAFAAPTREQAKRIFWHDIKQLVPQWMRKNVNETELSIELRNGTTLFVTGMDRPERIEGAPLDGIVLDEYANMKAQAWGEHVRPALSTPGRPPGWAWFIGVPEGRNHYWELWRRAIADDGSNGDAAALQAGYQRAWAGYTWTTASVNPEEAEAARRDLDALTYAQEYEGQFVNFDGKAYYGFASELQAAGRVEYNPEADLIFCFDFNRSPGVAVVAQEMPAPEWLPYERRRADGKVIAAVSEVYIERGSNTNQVCDRLLGHYRAHRGRVLLYGDATGGNKTSAAVDGSDWDLIEAKLRPVFNRPHQLLNEVRRSNPPERTRVNAVNARLESADGRVGAIVDPLQCPMLVRDFEGVTTLPTGEVDKPAGTMLTHLSDAWGYMIHERYPINAGAAAREL